MTVASCIYRLCRYNCDCSLLQKQFPERLSTFHSNLLALTKNYNYHLQFSAAAENAVANRTRSGRQSRPNRRYLE